MFTTEHKKRSVKIVLSNEEKQLTINYQNLFI